MNLTHIGSMPSALNFPKLWQVMKDLDIGLRVIGKHNFTDDMEGLNVFKTGWIDHSECIKYMKSARVLLLLINNSPVNEGILTGKIYEYLAACRPIFGVGPVNGEASQLLKETGHGVMVDYEDSELMRDYLYDFKTWMK